MEELPKGRSPGHHGVSPTSAWESEQRVMKGINPEMEGRTMSEPAAPRGKDMWTVVRRRGRGAQPNKGGSPGPGGLYALGDAQGARPKVGTRTDVPKVGTRTDVIIDSGASTCAAPRSLVGDGVPDASSRSYRTACGKSLTPDGTARVTLQFIDGRRLGAHFRVMDVTRPLASVSQMVEKGAWVVFRPESDGGSYMWTADGTSEKLFCRNGVYVLPCWVDRGPGFTGQPRGV